MEAVTLRFDFGELAVPYGVIYEPQHARASETPIYDQLVEEVLRGSSAQHYSSNT